MSGVSIEAVSQTPFSDTPNATFVKNMEVIPGSAHIRRLDRYRDTDGDGTKEIDSEEGIRAGIDSLGNVT